MNIALIVILGLLGALFGSFAVAQVWRLRARQLVKDKAEGEEYDAAELSRLKPLLRSVRSDRSECLSCHHTLAWYDLVPVVSWLSLSGKCRYCKAPIGHAEVLTEVGLAAVFIGSLLFWPFGLQSVPQVMAFILWLVGCVIATILLVYDAKWSLLPFGLNLSLIGVGVLYAVIQYGFAGVPFDVVSLLGAVALLGGLYLLFSLFGWVGMGDGILGVGLALFVGTWQLAFVTLFTANLLGCLMLIPLFIKKELRRNLRIPFGPFLILATMLSVLSGSILISVFYQLSDVVLFALVL